MKKYIVYDKNRWATIGFLVVLYLENRKKYMYMKIKCIYMYILWIYRQIRSYLFTVLNARRVACIQAMWGWSSYTLKVLPAVYEEKKSITNTRKILLKFLIDFWSKWLKSSSTVCHTDGNGMVIMCNIGTSAKRIEKVFDEEKKKK